MSFTMHIDMRQIGQEEVRLLVATSGQEPTEGLASFFFEPVSIWQRADLPLELH